MDNNREVEIKNYIENPDALIALCESVLNDLLGSIDDSDLIQMQAQLIEVSRSIDQLTKLSIGIPDELRDLKLSLMTEIEVQSQIREKLEKLLVQLQENVNRVNALYFTKHPKKKRRRRKKTRSDKPHTNPDVFRVEIIGALKSLGGSGTNKEVIEIIEERMKDKFLPGDVEKRARGVLVWKNNVHWVRTVSYTHLTLPTILLV